MMRPPSPQLVDIVIARVRHRRSVDLQKDGCCEPAKPLVPRRRVHDYRRSTATRPPAFSHTVGYASSPADGRLRTGNRRGEQADISNRWWITKEPASEFEQIVEVEELDGFRHWPRRSSASAWTSLIRSAAAATRERCSLRSTYSRIARRAASCIDTPSLAARSLSACCSSSVRRSVIAMTEWYQTDTTNGPQRSALKPFPATRVPYRPTVTAHLDRDGVPRRSKQMPRDDEILTMWAAELYAGTAPGGRASSTLGAGPYRDELNRPPLDSLGRSGERRSQRDRSAA